MPRTKREIDELKLDWIRDGTWDIHETYGFEDHREELKDFQRSYGERLLAMDDAQAREKLAARMQQLGCEGNPRLAAYVMTLEARLEEMEKHIAILVEHTDADLNVDDRVRRNFGI